ncbi:MAG: hypothetical protein JWO92_917 [Chitinophagaceae bacterium]|nr:hypothetical protein [Chitinophagaceae bacterium]MDB5223305.1 hypothetical protein [Chitinophagaceae bacterium]
MNFKSLKITLKHFTCWILCLQMVIIAIDLPGMINLKSNHSSHALCDENVPADDEQDIEKDSEELELFFSTTSADNIAPFQPLKHNTFYQFYNSLPVYDPHFPPPKAA